MFIITEADEAATHPFVLNMMTADVIHAARRFSNRKQNRLNGFECYKASVLATDPSATTATVALLRPLHLTIA